MIPKRLFELYPSFNSICKEDLQTMREAEKYLEIKNEKGKKVGKRDFKKNYPYEYYWGLYRSTFHYTTSREIFGEIYYFKNPYNFNF